jgi:hypothetical protein
MSYGMQPTSQTAAGGAANPHLRQQSSDLQFQDFLSIMAEPKAATPPPQQQQQFQQQPQPTATGGPSSGGFTAMLAGNALVGVQQQQQQQQQSPQHVNKQNAASMQVG